ncbi:hypothetical protein OSB04_028704 [Centaurea solstitialis]|uniref:Uncharacterized protein n=1 Tax=Centaurea solstitialis TaxID=347529 RepID=A0AA38T125_9ASTR|nr:hypothetical protein OSB04_028704 [Centaurea solstitialis]
MTQCSDQWLTTVSSLSWTNQGGTFPPHACSEGERCLPPPDQRGNVVYLRLIRRGTGKHPSPHRKKLRRPDLAGTGPRRNRTGESRRNRIFQEVIQSHYKILSVFVPDRMFFRRPDLAGTGCRRSRTGCQTKNFTQVFFFPEPDRRPRRNRNSPEPDVAGTGPENVLFDFKKEIKKSVTGTGCRRNRMSPEPGVAGTGCRRNRMSPEPDRKLSCPNLIKENEMEFVTGTGCRRNRTSPEPDVTGTGSEVIYLCVCISLTET